MHFLAGWIALGAGLANLLRRKGTGAHRAFGYLYVLGTGLVALDAALRAAHGGGVDLVAAAAAAGAALTVWAVLPFARRQPGCVRRHALRMQAAYVVLCAAAGNVLLAGTAAGRIAVIALTLAILAVGAWLARLQRPEIERVSIGAGR